jgi:hypothetical protein
VVLPVLVVLAVGSILWWDAHPQNRPVLPLFLSGGTAENAPPSAPVGPGLLDQAITASGLLDPADPGSWGESGVWLALPNGPLMARWLEPELRLMLRLRGKLSSGGPFVLPGPLLLQQAGPAAEALLQRSAPATTVAQAKG